MCVHTVVSLSVGSDTAMLPLTLAAATTTWKLMFFNYFPLRTFYIDKFHGIKKHITFTFKRKIVKTNNENVAS